MTRRKAKKYTQRQETLVQSIERRFLGVEDNTDASHTLCDELYSNYCETCSKSKKTFLGFEKGKKQNSTVADFLRHVDAFVDGVSRREIVFSLETGEKVLDTIRFLEWCVAGRHVYTAKCVQHIADDKHKKTLANFSSSLLALYSIQDEARSAVQKFKRKEKARKQKLRKKQEKNEVSNVYSHIGEDDDGIDEDEEYKEVSTVSPTTIVQEITTERVDQWEHHEKEWQDIKLRSMELVKVIATQDFGPGYDIHSVGTDMVTLPPFGIGYENDTKIPLPVQTVLDIMKRLRRSRKLLYSLGHRLRDPELKFVDPTDDTSGTMISVTKAISSFLENLLVFLNTVSDEQLALLNSLNFYFWDTVLQLTSVSKVFRIPTERDYSDIMYRTTLTARTMPLYHTLMCTYILSGYRELLLNPVGGEEAQRMWPMTANELQRSRQKERQEFLRDIRRLRPKLADITRIVRMEEKYEAGNIYGRDGDSGWRQDFTEKPLLDYVHLFDYRAKLRMFLPVKVVRYQVEDDTDDDGVILYMVDTRVEDYVNTLLQERAGKYGLDIHDASKNATYHPYFKPGLEYNKVSGIVHTDHRVTDLRGRDSLHDKVKQMEEAEMWMQGLHSRKLISSNWDRLVEMMLEEIIADHVEYQEEGALTKRLRELDIAERQTKEQGVVETTDRVQERIFRRLSKMKLVPFKLVDQSVM